jgi:hypothetical protein
MLDWNPSVLIYLFEGAECCNKAGIATVVKLSCAKLEGTTTLNHDI